MAESIELFRRNGIVSTIGQVGGVLGAPPDEELAPLREDVGELVREAEQRDVMLRLGVLRLYEPYQKEMVTVYAVDVKSPHDEYGFIRRLAEILNRHGIKQLDYDLDTDRVFELTMQLVQRSQAPHE